VPIRSYLESEAGGTVLNDTPFASIVVCRRYCGHNLRTVKKLATERGGKHLDGIHFASQDGQVKPLLSLLSYLGTGEYRKRYLGVPIPPTKIQENQLQEARTFANGLADRLVVENPRRVTRSRAVPRDRRQRPTKWPLSRLALTARQPPLMPACASARAALSCLAPPPSICATDFLTALASVVSTVSPFARS
jgi:hypothetical protein